MIGDCNGETNFPHKLLLSGRHIPKFRKGFANNSSANVN